MGVLLNFAVLAVALVALVVVGGAWWLRTGVGPGVATPPGFRKLPWRGALRISCAQQIRPNAITAAAIVPGLGHLLLGRRRRAFAVVGALLAVGVTAALVGHATGACTCGPTHAATRDAILNVTSLAVLAIMLMAILDVMRTATRDAMYRSIRHAAIWVREAEQAMASCPRCRAAQRTGDGFCADCQAALAGSRLDPGAPAIRATDTAAWLGDGQLAAYRAPRVVIGSLAGESVSMSRRFEAVYGRRINRLLRHRERVVDHAWSDPHDPTRVWTVERQRWDGYSGETSELRSVCLHQFGVDGLASSWTVGVLGFDRWPSTRSVALAAAAPAL